MKQTKIKNFWNKQASIAAAILLTVAAILPMLAPEVAHASQVTSRSIELSDSAAGDTGVAYQVGFTAPSNATIKGIVVDFCDNDPIVGDSTCTLPTGFSLASATVTTSGGSNTGLTGTWSVTLANSNRTLELTNSTGTALNNTAVIFTINSVTNPSTANHTFYARILTYTTTAGATSYAPGTEGAYTDYGGVALSTAATITITSKVQEQITFCVFTNAAGSCGSASGTSVTLGDTHGILSTSGPFVDVNTQYIIATNASNGATIRIKGNTLQSGGNSIAAIGSSSASSSAGTSQFGLCTYEASGSNLTPSSPYNDANCNTTSQTAGTGSTGGNGTAKFAFNTTNTTSTYGDTLATATAGSSSTGTVAFIGNISTGQQAGIYTTTITFIATGTY